MMQVESALLRSNLCKRSWSFGLKNLALIFFPTFTWIYYTRKQIFLVIRLSFKIRGTVNFRAIFCPRYCAKNVQIRQTKKTLILYYKFRYHVP